MLSQRHFRFKYIITFNHRDWKEDDRKPGVEGLGAVAQLGEAAQLVGGEGDEGLENFSMRVMAALEILDLGRGERRGIPGSVSWRKSV